MTPPDTIKKQTPAQLRRECEKLRRLVQAERERADRAWDGYRSALHELVEVKMRLEAVERALRGEV